MQLHGVGDRRLGEARPAGAGVELRVRAEQLVAAGAAAVDAVGLRVRVRAGERRLGALLAQDVEAVGRELLAPLLHPSSRASRSSVAEPPAVGRSSRQAQRTRRRARRTRAPRPRWRAGRGRRPGPRTSGRPRRAPGAGRRGPGPPTASISSVQLPMFGIARRRRQAGSCSRQVGAARGHLARRAHQRDRALRREAAGVELRRRAARPARRPRAARAACRRRSGARGGARCGAGSPPRGRTRSAARRPPRRAPRTARGAGAGAATACAG